MVPTGFLRDESTRIVFLCRFEIPFKPPAKQKGFTVEASLRNFLGDFSFSFSRLGSVFSFGWLLSLVVLQSNFII